jgi:hypothetical protein
VREDEVEEEREVEVKVEAGVKVAVYQYAHHPRLLPWELI